jgi:tetratricopeptide (TPR) repeat protein
MRLLWPIIGLAVCLPGCVSPREERAGDFNADGVHLFQHGAYEQAGETFQAALALKPDDANILYNLGECYHRRGALAAAERYYKQCLERDPDHGPCRFALAALWVQMGRNAETQRMIEDWLARQPGRADAYALDGWFSHQAGDLPCAQARLQQALQIEPHHARALIELGLLYEAMQRPDRAVVLYERVLDDDPKQAEVKQRLQGLLTRGVGKPQPD